MFNHLKENKEAYLIHFKFAFTKSMKSYYVATALLIHSILPCIFIKTFSNFINKQYNDILERHKK